MSSSRFRPGLPLWVAIKCPARPASAIGFQTASKPSGSSSARIMAPTFSTPAKFMVPLFSFTSFSSRATERSYSESTV